MTQYIQLQLQYQYFRYIIKKKRKEGKVGREVTKEIAIQHKKQAIRKMGNVFEAFINNPDDKYLKKADLLAYWLETFSSYLLDEQKFDYSKIPSYKRGDVISVNLGFNVGSEQGGLHYAIVLNNDNQQSSPVITIVPLSSGKEEDTFPRDIFLGNELYDKLKSKYNKLDAKIKSELQEAIRIQKVIQDSLKNLKDNPTRNAETNLANLLTSIEQKINTLNTAKKTLNIYNKELQKLKKGSIALMEQITTVSKMRIYKPKNSNDLLYGIKYSDGAMDKINERMKELFIYSK